MLSCLVSEHQGEIIIKLAILPSNDQEDVEEIII
jgi:hypothetical protein